MQLPVIQVPGQQEARAHGVILTRFGTQKVQFPCELVRDLDRFGGDQP